MLGLNGHYKIVQYITING